VFAVLLSCGLLAACGSTGQPSSGTGAANGASGDKSRDSKFAQCMRSHGVTTFPDPTAGGGIELPTNLNPQFPAFRSAQRACHGVPQFPDPALSPVRNAQRVLIMPGMAFAIPSSVDPKSPTFQHAARACGIGTR
jgi:hypothetical protein